MWRFSESVAPARSARLLGYAGFDDIVEMLMDPDVVEFSWEPFVAERLKGCHRASFLLSVPENVYDAFFNSPAGYRGQFAVQPAVGEAANRRVLSRLQASLERLASKRGLVPEALVRASLEGVDAKIWILEKEVEDQLGRDQPEVIFAPWQGTSPEGAGLLAPVGTRLEVKGAWLDERGVERRDPCKAHRSEEIHSTGYS